MITNKDAYAISTGNDADSDRHGIVTPDFGLMNPNAYLAVAIQYLYANRPGWRPDAGIGKTLVSSSMIDRVAASLGRTLIEVPVGFKWFVPGLRSGDIGFGGEESAGASFLALDGSTWTTDKDGILLALLASEIKAVTGKSPSELYAELTAEHGAPAYARVDAPANREQKAKLAKLDASAVTATELAGEPITQILTTAPGNNAAIGGLKVATESAWFAARPSGTEDVYKIYAESFQGPEHLAQVQEAARAVVSAALVPDVPQPTCQILSSLRPAERLTSRRVTLNNHRLRRVSLVSNTGGDMTFEDWLREQLPRMVRFADALCGRSVSEEIVQDVAVKVHARWSKIEKLEHREAYVRRMITNEYLSWRRKWARLVPHAELDDHLRRPNRASPTSTPTAPS